MTTCFRAQEVYTSVRAYTSRVLEQQGKLTDRIEELCFLLRTYVRACICIERLYRRLLAHIHTRDGRSSGGLFEEH